MFNFREDFEKLTEKNFKLCAEEQNDIARFNARIYELSEERKRKVEIILRNLDNTQKSESQIEYNERLVNNDFYFESF